MTALWSRGGGDPLTRNLARRLTRNAIGMVVGVVAWLFLANLLFSNVFNRAPENPVLNESLAEANDSVREVIAFANSGGALTGNESAVQYPAAIEVGPAGAGNAFGRGLSVAPPKETVPEPKADLADLIRAKQAQAPAEVKLNLKGIINAGGAQLAIIEGPRGSRTVAAGDVMENWTVSAIGGGRVVLVQGTETRTIVWEAGK